LGRARANALFAVALLLVVIVSLVAVEWLAIDRQASDGNSVERRTIGIEFALRDDVAIARLRTLRAVLLARGTIPLPERLAAEASLTRLYDFNSGVAHGFGLDKRLERVETAWSAIPERGVQGPALDATLAAALELRAAIDARAAFQTTADAPSRALLDAFAVQLPEFEGRVDEERTVALLLRREPAWRAAISATNRASSDPAERALTSLRADVARAAAVDPAERPALAAIARVTAAWQRFERAPSEATVDARGSALLSATEIVAARLARDARRELALEAAGQRSRLGWLEAGLLGTLLVVLCGSVVLVQFVRARERSDLEAEERLAYAATHDMAVDLPNRAYLFERMRATLFERPETRTVAGVVFIDFDGFKLVNDSLGHLAGERLLREAARRIRATVESSDLVARFGGDEFVVLLQGRASRDRLIEVAQHILAALAEPISLEERDAYVTVTVGLAVVDRPYETVEEIVRDADTAMYAAKTSGRTRFAVFDASMHDRSRRRMELATQLRRAIEREQLHLLYQPITSLTDGRIQSFEVLLRWEHPELGLVNPAEFVPVAEEVGLIVPIGRWVFERACAQLARWRERRGTIAFEALHLSVNASVLELLQPGYCEFVERTIARHALHPGDIVLEITESTILESGRFAVATLDRLRRAGLRLAIDDFGTGYSSLRYLREFPFDYLKIDGSFVRGSDGGLASEAIVTMIVALGNAVGVQVIAEGAETPEQVERLRALGCGAVQGFLFGTPSSAALVPAMLRVAS
jgi:diguanylate cyclase (GGDEF)-like protein